MLFNVRFIYNRLKEKLWVRPLVFCIAAVAFAFAAAITDRLGFEGSVPKIDHDTVEKLLSIIAASMLGVATFAVGSMVAAYGSVSSNATPRAFTLVIADDVSKTVLSTFIAAFIFSVVALIAIKTGYYERTGLFVVFITTIFVLGWVVFSFVRWVDQIARLGRLGTTIDRVEKAAEAAFKRHRDLPNLGALPVSEGDDPGKPIFSGEIGYVQHINVEALQGCAEKHNGVLTVAAPPGAFVAPGRAVCFFKNQTGTMPGDFDDTLVTKAFVIGDGRTYEDDARFGLIALAEIAARALSPAVNDPGTAIDIIGTFVRLFAYWVSPPDEKNTSKRKFDRVRVPSLELDEMFDDAFTAISRDGAGAIEVVIRLQKAFISLSAIGRADIKKAALHHSQIAVARAELSLKLPYEIERVRTLAAKVG